MAEDVVDITLPDGSPATVARAELDQAVSAGAKPVAPAPATPEDDPYYSGALGQTVAGLSGVASGITAGLSDSLVAKGVGLIRGGLDEGKRNAATWSAYDDLQGVAKANPWTHGAGEVAGLLGPGLLGGAGAALTPTGAISELGAGAEAGAARLLGAPASTALGRVAQKGAALGAQGLTEGALFGGAETLHDADLGDPAAGGEKLFANVARGALLGGAAGATLGVGGALVGEGRRALGGGKQLLGGAPVGAHGANTADVEAMLARDAEKSAEAAARIDSVAETHGTTGGAVRAAADEAMAAAQVPGGGLLDDAAEKVIQARAAGNTELADAMRAAYKDRASTLAGHDEALDNLARAAAKDFEPLIQADNVISQGTLGRAKEAQMAKLVDAAKWREASQHAAEAYFDIERTVAGLDELATKGGRPGDVNQLKKVLVDFKNEIATVGKGSKEEIAGKLFGRLDDVKREVGKAAKMGVSEVDRAMLGEAPERFYDLYHRLRDGLENEAIWGKAGAAQKDINAALSDKIGTRRLFDNHFLTRGKSAAGNATKEADPGKFRQFFAGIDTPGADLARRDMGEYIRTMRDHIGVVEKHYAFGEAEKAALAKAKESLGTLEARVAGAEKQASVIRTVKRIQTEEMNRGIGGAIGLVADIFTRPMKTIERLATIKQAIAQADVALKRGVRAFMSGERTAQVAPKLAASEAKARTVAKEIAAVAADPAKVEQRISAALGDTSTVPGVGSHASATAVRAFTFLASKAPKAPPPVSTFSSKERHVSDEDVATFARYVEATTDPLGTVTRGLATGRLRPAHVEALKAVYPALYNELRSEVVRAIPKWGPRMTYEQQEMVGTLFDVAVNAYQDPGFMAAVQATFIPATPPKESIPGATDVNLSKMVSNTQSASQGLEASQ